MKKYVLSLITLTLLLCEASFTGGIAFANNAVGDYWNDGNYTYTIKTVAPSTSSAGKVSVKAKSGASISGDVVLSSQVSHTFGVLFTTTYTYNVTEIEANGFQNQTNLSSIQISSNITTIGTNAFSGCTKLDSVAWMATNCNNFSSDSNSPFYAIRSQIKSVSVGAGVTKIPAYLCYDMTNLENVIAYYYTSSGSNSIASIGNRAFYNCSKATGLSNLINSTRAKSLTSIADYAFYNCDKLTGSLTLSTALESISGYAFSGCSGLTAITLPASLTSLGTNVFFNCNKLATVTWNSTSLTSIPDYTFKGCSLLKKVGSTSNVVTIPSNISTIGTSAFENCSTIVAVVIPTSVTTINSSAFYGCSNITSVTYAGDAAQWGNISFGTADANPCYYAKGIKFSGGSSVTTSITAGSSTYKTIKAYAFYNDTSLTSLSISTSATTINTNAFYGCKNVKSIVIPASITSIGSDAFSNCFKLKTVTWNPTTYADCSSTASTQPFYAIRGQITSFSFNTGSSFTKIPDYLCYGMTNLKNITIPRYVRTIGTNAFNSSGVENIVWNVDTIAPSTYTSSSQPFMNIKSQIKTFSFGSNVKNIPNYLCYQMTGLTAVTIPNGVTTVGSYIFQGCSNLENITWNASNVKSCSLSWCYPDAIRGNIKSFTLGSSVTKVPSYMCYHMSGLDQLVSYATSAPSTIGTSAFSNVTKCLTILPGATGYTSSPWTSFTPGICDNDVVSGVCGAQGDNLTWSLNLTSGELTISGEGEMADYSSSNPTKSPWYDVKSHIKSVTIGNKVASIGEFAFYDLSNLVTLSFESESSVKCVKKDAFKSCGKLKLPTLPKSIEWIGYEAFYMGYSITSVDFEEGSKLDSIGSWAFQNCTALVSVTIPEQVRVFQGSSTFSGCSILESVTWNAINCKDFTSGMGPFNNIKANITSFKFGDAVEYIPAYLCDGMNNADFNTIAISENVTSINKNAFNGCSSLSSITWKAENCPGFSSASNSPFYTIRTNITSVEFGENVRLIPAYLCYGMNNADFNSVTIPAMVDSIGNSAFSSCSNLHNVNYLGTDANAWASIGFYGYSSNPIYYAKGLSIGGSPLTACTVSVSVKPYAFYNDTLLTSLTLDDGATSIASNAFYGCSKLENIGCAASANLASIGSSAFSGCSALADITLPASLQEVRSSAFDYCSALGTNGSVNYLGTANQWANITFASKSCNPAGLAHKLKINGDVVTACTLSAPVKAYTFADNTSLTSLTLGAGCTTIGASAFEGCSKLGGTITFPSSITEVASQAFRSCTSISGLDFTQASSLMTLGSSAFYGCTNVAGELHFPASLSSIAGNVFQNITGITAIYANRTEAPTDLNSYTFNSVSKSIPFYVTSATAFSYYANAPYWQDFTNMFYYGYCGAEGNEENVIWAYNPTTGALNIFGTGAMAGYDYVHDVFAPWYDLKDDITSVSIGEGITRIGEQAFRVCANMTTVALPASITEIGDRAFDGCSGLLSYTYAGTVNDWLDITFEYFSSNPMYYVHKFYVNGSEEVTNLVIPNGMTTVKDNAFRNCTGLTTLSLPASITTITGAFTGCTGLTSYSYAGTVADWLHISITNADGNPMKYVHKFMVNGDEEVTDLVVPDGITSISQFAFYMCSGLTSVTIPASLTSIGLSAFSSCSHIDDVNYLGTISQWCAINFENNFANPAWFSQSLSLNGVEQINIYLPDELPEIKNYVFAKNTTAETISVNNSTTIGTHAFDQCTAEILYRGNTGGETADGLSWSLVDGLLTISGTGAMSDYSEATTPWYPYRSAITGIVVGEGVTAIGSSAFVKTSATSVLIASTVETIGDWAFSECTSLTQITCNAETPPTILDGKDGPSSYSSRTFNGIPVDIVVMVPIGSTSAYQESLTDSHNTTSGWARFTNYQEPAVTDIDIIDSENNGVTLTTYNGREMTVHLTRSLISASYNTICLPFAMTADQVASAFGANCDIEELTRASYADGNLKLFFTKRTAIEAGKPYLIQPQANVVDPVIAGVTIDNTPRPSVFEGVTFTGIFSPTALANSENLLFLGASNTLYMSNGANPMKGLRGYFTLTTPGSQAAARRSARIILHEEAATGIEEVRTENANAARSEKIMRNGQLYILRDGKTYNAQGALMK